MVLFAAPKAIAESMSICDVNNIDKKDSTVLLKPQGSSFLLDNKRTKSLISFISQDFPQYPIALSYPSQYQHMKQKLLYLLLGVTLSFGISANDTLNPCVRGEAFHIVVLGSSTAAGTGPSSSDSTWVNRYRKYLQKINPANQVTNLAQGGTTTYEIMPDWFVAPPGRRVTNPARNVTQAISISADAIVINMPSNDAALGYSVAEQLFNFNTIVASADSAGIPVWVCTTQPRNFSATQIQVQMDVRDSVLAIYGNKAIDFWTTIANTTGTIDSLYDSNDGVHLNDAGHRILFQRVRDKNILSALIDTTGIEDHFVFNLLVQRSICGSKHDTISMLVSNRGTASNYNLPFVWQIRDINNLNTQFIYDTLSGGVASCISRKVSTTINTAMGGRWQITGKLLTKNDTTLGNDSARLELITIGEPKVWGSNDTVCRNQPAAIWAAGGDTTLWYDMQGNLLGYGDSLSVSGIGQTGTYRASIVKGPLFYEEELAASSTSGINFPGIMFDLVATDTLVLDSLTLRVQTIGPQEVTGHYKAGSYKGFEGLATAWTLWGKDTVDILQAADWAQVSFGPKTLLPGDTLGVYLDMQNGSQLQYEWASSEVSYTDGKLNLISGAGIAHSFGTAYYPRLWNGKVHYHHGYNPNGYCTKDSLITVVVQANQIDLGNDTVLDFSQSLNLSLGNGFTSILWSTGDTVSQISVDTTQLTGSGTYVIFVMAEDRFGCSASDTIRVSFTNKVGLWQEAVLADLQVYPNPAKGKFTLQWNGEQPQELEIYNTNGQLIKKVIVSPGSHSRQLLLPSGLYFVYPYGKEEPEPIKLVVQ